MIPIENAAVLVTGAGGFVGGHLLRELERRGARVQGLGSDRRPSELAPAAWHAVDIRDPAALAAGVAAAVPDAVVHLAGQSSAGRSFEQPLETFHSNALGTWNLLEAVRVHAPAARVLIAGSGEIYGPQPQGSRVNERAPLRPVSPYALSKAAADVFGEVAAAVHGLDVVRTRSFAHTGPGQGAAFVVPSWAEQIAAMERGEAEPILRVGNLEVTRDLSDVRDVVAAYVTLLERGHGGAAYNVCRGAGIALSEVARRMVERARVEVRIEVDPARRRAADVPYLVGDPGAIARDTGWQAAIQIERTLDDVLDDWRTRGTGGRPRGQLDSGTPARPPESIAGH